MPLSKHPVVPIFQAVAIGGIGGAAAAGLGLPLAWMMGAMMASGFGAMMGMRGHIPQNIRRVVLAVAGVYIGVEITPGLLAQLGALPLSLGMLLLYVTAATAGAAWAFRKWLKTSWATACCAAVPGGLSAAIALAEGRGDDRLVALVHILRVALVVITIPVIARSSGAFNGVLAEPAGGWDYAAELTHWRGLAEVALIAGCVSVLGIRCTFKAPAFLLIAVILSAAARLAGVSEGQLPDLPLNIAMLVLGTAIGCGCYVMRGKGMLRLLLAGLSVMGGTIGLAVLFAYAAAAMMGIPFHLALLFFAPGGIAEMSLIAVALGADPPLVVLHQTLRILLILLVTPQVIAIIERKAKGGG